MVVNEIVSRISEMLNQAAGKPCAFMLIWSPKPHDKHYWIHNLENKTGVPKWLAKVSKSIKKRLAEGGSHRIE